MRNNESPSPGGVRVQPAASRHLVILPVGALGPATDVPPRHLLGLTIARRAELAARRAGYARTTVVGDDPASNGVAPSGPVAGEASGRLVIVPAHALAEIGWLEAAAELELPANGWGHAEGRAIVVDVPTVMTAGVRIDAVRLEEIAHRLAAALGEARQLPVAATPFLVRGPGDLRPARRRLLRALVKDTDGFMARHVERPISIAITRWLAETPVTPNQMTLVSVGFGLIGAPFFLSASPVWQTVGALLFLWHSILDGCDGELARLKFSESRWGGILDFWGDNVVHVAIFACMAIGWAHTIDAAWPLILGACAVGGTIASASWVYFRTMRRKDDGGPLYTSVSAEPSAGLSRLLDGASRRDFIYLVVAAALFGKASWFLVMAGIGAPVFFALLLLTAAREGRSRRQSDA